MSRIVGMASVIIVCFFMTLAPSAAAEGPWVGITSPEDGDWVTTNEVRVEGTAAPVGSSVVISGEEFQRGEFQNVESFGEELRFKPIQWFRDDFDGVELNSDRWQVLNDTGTLKVESGLLKLSQVWPQTGIPLVRTGEGIFPEVGDLCAEFKLKFDSYCYSPGGGGIGKGSPGVDSSHLATVHYFEQWQEPWYRVYADGEMVLSSIQMDVEEHVYTLKYDTRSDRYTCYRDGEALATFSTDDAPDHFWFGADKWTSMYQYFPTISVDYVDLWTFTGEWTSEPFQMDHDYVLDDARVLWSSSNSNAAVVDLEMRSSDDCSNWTDWVLVDKRNGGIGLEGKWLQVKVDLALPEIKRTGANIRVSGIELDYHHPLVSVEVRGEGGEWTPASGLAEWSAMLELQEDDNIIEVRVTDSSGAVNTDILRVNVDTTPPTGAMEILSGYEYTNDPTVHLALSATDKHGVRFVELSNCPDFYTYQRLPFAKEMDWELNGAEGESRVYARFVDAHGLVSEVVSDSIIFDSVNPMASITIEEGEMYTPGRMVDLEFEFSDDNEVSRVELSNHDDFRDAWNVPLDMAWVEAWDLLEGGDGERAVHIRVTDVAGNTFVASDSIDLFWPKAYGTLTINEGAAVTGRINVDLAVEVPLEHRISLMQLSNDPTFEGAEWEPLTKERWWLLPEGDGEKHIYARFLDFRDIVSLPIEAGIVLDTTPPEVTVLIDGGAAYTTDTEVEVRIDYVDAHPPLRMWISPEDAFVGGPTEFLESFNWTVPARESDHYLYAWVEDRAGNTGKHHAIIHYATIRPIIELELPDGEVFGDTDRIALGVTETDPYGGVEVQVGFNGDPAGDAPWQPLSANVWAMVPPGTEDGPHEVRIRARNAAGLESGIVTILVIRDTVPPELTIVQPRDGATIPQRGHEVLLEVEVGDTTYVIRVSYDVDERGVIELPDGITATVVDVEEFGTHTIEVVAEDAGGNVATETATFRIEDTDAAVMGGSSIVWLLALVVVATAGGLAYGGWRRRLHGAEPEIHPGDGWEEEWDAPIDEEAEEVDEPDEEVLEDTGPEEPTYELPAGELEAVEIPSEWEEIQ